CVGSELHSGCVWRWLCQAIIPGFARQSSLCGQVLGLLVPVGLTPIARLPRLAYQPSVLAGGLTPRWGGRPCLEASFPLRCFQRLSLPNVANQPCPWRDNWHTRGSSVPVLSYWGQPFSSLLRARRIGTELSHDVLNPARVPLSWANSPTLGNYSSPRTRRAD